MALDDFGGVDGKLREYLDCAALRSADFLGLGLAFLGLSGKKAW